jgi:hypothetical protein
MYAAADTWQYNKDTRAHALCTSKALSGRTSRPLKERWRSRKVYLDHIKRDEGKWMSNLMGEVDGIRRKKALSGGEKNSSNLESRLHQWVDKDWSDDTFGVEDDGNVTLSMEDREEEDLQYALYLSLLECGLHSSGRQYEVDILDLLKPCKGNKRRKKSSSASPFDGESARPCSPGGWSLVSEEEWQEVVLALAEEDELDEWEEWGSEDLG